MEEPRCPTCGFAYAWRGSSCGHCGHPERHEPPAEKPPGAEARERALLLLALPLYLGFLMLGTLFRPIDLAASWAWRRLRGLAGRGD